MGERPLRQLLPVVPFLFVAVAESTFDCICIPLEKELEANIVLVSRKGGGSATKRNMGSEKEKENCEKY